MNETTGDERAALEGMLRAYPVDQLVEEVLVAWQELADRNEDLVTSKQRLRVLEWISLNVKMRSLQKLPN